MFSKWPSDRKVLFGVLIIINSSLTSIGISCYSIKVIDDVLAIRWSKLRFVVSILLRINFTIYALIILKNVEYKFHDFEEFTFNLMAWASIANIVAVPLFVHVMQKRYFTIITSITLLDQLIANEIVLIKKPAYRQLMRSILIGLIVCFVYGIIFLNSFYNGVQSICFLNTITHYVYYSLFLNITLCFSVYLQCMQLCFKCINQAIVDMKSVRRRDRFLGDGLVDLIKLHEITVDNLRTILDYFSGAIILTLLSSGITTVFTIFGVLKSTMEMKMAGCLIINCFFSSIPLLTIFYWGDLAITEACRIFSLAKTFPLDKRVSQLLVGLFFKRYDYKLCGFFTIRAAVLVTVFHVLVQYVVVVYQFAEKH